jgi:hypothetical protein
MQLTVIDKMNHTTIRISVAAAIAASILVLGTSLAPIIQQQAYAGSQRHPLKQEQSAVQNIRKNIDKRNAEQHADFENLCVRADDCRNSNVGQQIQGNDNSVTGFADQSENIQQLAAAQAPVENRTTTPSNQTGNQTSGGGGGVQCTNVTITGLLNQTASVNVCLIPGVSTVVDIPGIGPTTVVLTTDGCPRGFINAAVNVGSLHLCVALNIGGTIR